MISLYLFSLCVFFLLFFVLPLFVPPLFLLCVLFVCFSVRRRDLFFVLFLFLYYLFLFPPVNFSFVCPLFFERFFVALIFFFVHSQAFLF